MYSGEMFVPGVFLCTPFILSPFWWDKSAILRILQGYFSGTSHILLTLLRHFFCKVFYLANVLLFITPWLLLRFLKQYPQLLNIGQHLLSNPFKSGGGFSDQIGLRKTFLWSSSGDRIQSLFLYGFWASSALASLV